MTINTFFQESMDNLGSVVRLHGRATGAATSSFTGVKGPWTITRSNVGIHSLVLNRKFAGLLNAQFAVIDTGTIDDWEVTLSSDLTSGTTIGLQIFKGGTAADMPTTAKLLITLTLQDTSAKPAGF